MHESPVVRNLKRKKWLNDAIKKFFNNNEQDNEKREQCANIL